MNELLKIKERACEDLYTYLEQDEYSMSDYDNMKVITSVIKNIDMISGMGDKKRSRGGHYDGGNAGGNNYANGGNYSRNYSGGNGGGGYASNNYSYRDGGTRNYDDARTRMVQQLEDVMRGATDERTRHAVQYCIDTVKQGQ